MLGIALVEVEELPAADLGEETAPEEACRRGCMNASEPPPLAIMPISRTPGARMCKYSGVVAAHARAPPAELTHLCTPPGGSRVLFWKLLFWMPEQHSSTPPHHHSPEHNPNRRLGEHHTTENR